MRAILDSLVRAVEEHDPGTILSHVAFDFRSEDDLGYADVQSLVRIAKATGGRFYNVKDPSTLPQIFIKEAQVIRRALIVEKTFSPIVTFGLSEIVKGTAGELPPLDGYILTGRKGGLTQTVLSNSEGDPILATGQAGLGRCVAFTSTGDARWAGNWLGWGGFDRFWEQTIRWVSKSSQSGDCEIFTDVMGRQVTVSVEAVDEEGNFVQFTDIAGQVIDPGMSSRELSLSQVGPGMYRAQFQVDNPGSYLVNLRYRKPGGEEGETGLVQTVVTVPYAAEFRDLSDNAALLAEVARMTDGRIVNSDPEKAELFSRAGLSFPQTSLPLSEPLIYVLLALLLLDVAVRRIALDLRAIARRVASAVERLRRGAPQSATLNRLKLRRAKVQERLKTRAERKHASRRFEATAEARASEPVASGPAVRKPPAKEPTPKPPEKTPEETTHLQQLLKTKRRSADRLRPEKEQPGEDRDG